MSSIYIHIPFCKTKCLYCDFYSKRCNDRSIHSRLIDALCLEFLSRRKELRSDVDTIYIGGGTPSLIAGTEISRLINNIKETGGNRINTSEITIEANPDDVTHEMASSWYESGINRVSMGIQSFKDNELQIINRRHTSKKAVDSFKTLQEFFNNISIDLIFGLPGQSLADWEYNLQRAVELAPQHISIYSLMYEPGTALTKLRDSGKITPVSDDLSYCMFEITSRILADHGYSHYEISNYALPGYESRHNSGYWNGTQYLGIGPAAHSFDGIRTRKWNSADVDSYLNNFQEEHIVISETEGIETLTDTELLEETILTSLRTARGINLNDFAKRFGDKALSELMRNSHKFIDNGLLSVSDPENHDWIVNRFPTEGENRGLCTDQAFLVLTEKGIMTSDNIILSLIS